MRERSRILFGAPKNGPEEQASRGRRKARQLNLFEEPGMAPGGGAPLTPAETPPTPGATTLDRVHQSMLLFADGRSDAMRRFLVEDGAGADTRFWSLAQALSALYPKGSEEKRWVDGVLARKKGLGF